MTPPTARWLGRLAYQPALDLQEKTLAARAAGETPDYVALVDAVTLEPLANLDRPAVLAAAVKIGETRLIDNVQLALRHAKI